MHRFTVDKRDSGPKNIILLLPRPKEIDDIDEVRRFIADNFA